MKGKKQNQTHAKPQRGQKTLNKDLLSTEDTEKHGNRTQNKNFDFSGFELFRDFRDFRGPEKDFKGFCPRKTRKARK
jgi:hypothetical protein